MVFYSFEELFTTEFIVTEPMAMNQFWHPEKDVYNAIGKPKISHTFFWVKNCTATVTLKNGTVFSVGRNQLMYMPKGAEYTVELSDTGCAAGDSVVVHFQLHTLEGAELAASHLPMICLEHVDGETAALIDGIVAEYQKAVLCVPELIGAIFRLIGVVSSHRHHRVISKKFACIQPGIRMLEESDRFSVEEIAGVCGVSACYFRRLFKEYSGLSPSDFRQRKRIEKAKRLLLSDDNLSISEIAEVLHFADVYHFSKTFKKWTGVSPSRFSRQ